MCIATQEKKIYECCVMYVLLMLINFFPSTMIFRSKIAVETMTPWRKRSKKDGTLHLNVGFTHEAILGF